MKEKQLMEGKKGREKYLEEWLWRVGPQDFVSCYFCKREPYVWYAREDIVLHPFIITHIFATADI